MRTLFIALSFAALAGLTTACGAAPRGEPVAASAEPALRAPGEARIGDRTTCPVSGEQFIVSATSPKAEHEGKTYYFCCVDCAKRFEAEPGKFLKQADPVGQRQAAEPSSL